ncbi:hypothetical protein H1C71_032914 [Ictidomys tridecemlineatus]|nr:hypothetical protein H1C71_032914 [Ictidomys tridecemlineatus]
MNGKAIFKNSVTFLKLKKKDESFNRLCWQNKRANRAKRELGGPNQKERHRHILPQTLSSLWTYSPPVLLQLHRSPRLYLTPVPSGLHWGPPPISVSFLPAVTKGPDQDNCEGGKVYLGAHSFRGLRP